MPKDTSNALDVLSSQCAQRTLNITGIQGVLSSQCAQRTLNITGIQVVFKRFKHLYLMESQRFK